MQLHHSLLMPDESDHDFQQTLAGYTRTFQPANYVEFDLLRLLATASWRLHRLHVMETGVLNIEISHRNRDYEEEGSGRGGGMRAGAAFRKLAADSSVIEEFRQTEAHLHKIYDQTLRILLDLQENGPSEDQPDAGPFLVKKVA